MVKIKINEKENYEIEIPQEIGYEEVSLLANRFNFISRLMTKGNLISAVMETPNLVLQKRRGEIAEKQPEINPEFINPVELFTKIFENPYSYEIYKREYLWNIIKRMLKIMRKRGELFVINEISRLYVLQSFEEAKSLKKKLNRHIKNIQNIKSDADEWVKNQKWRKVMDYGENKRE